MTSRAQRNHNPLNIRKGSPWQGIDPSGKDTSFVTFISDIYGFRAAFRILRNYINATPPRNTIAKIITRWAPPSDDNPLGNYIAFVEQRTGIDRNTTLVYEDHNSMITLVEAMAKFESGHNYPRETIVQGYLLEKK